MVNNNGNKQLYRSKSDKIILGVAGGLANYFQQDPSLVRLLWVILALSGGGGVLIYAVLAIILPEEGGKKVNMEKTFEDVGGKTSEAIKKIRSGEKGGNLRLWLGLIVVTVGIISLAGQLFPFLWKNDYWGPLLLIGAGLYLLF